MPTPSKGPRLGGGPAHERLLLNNLAGQLFEHKQITTTVTKAKRLRPVAERMITFAKRGDLASRRRVLSRISDQGIVHVLFTEIAPAVANREGGYTRITKIGPRKGDKAPMAVVELVLEPMSPKKATVAEAEAATKRGAEDSAAAAAPAEDAAAEAPEEAAEEAPAESDEAPAEDAAAEAAEEAAEEAVESEEAPAEDATDEAASDEESATKDDA